MSLAGFLNTGQTIADPLHLTGWSAQPGEGSTVSGGAGGPAVAMDPGEENRLRAQQYADWQAQQAALQEQHKGFMSSMGVNPRSVSSFVGEHPSAMPAAPPPVWAYQPGKGPSWMTPQHTLQAGPDKQSQNWSYSVSPTGNPFAGNRI